MKKSSQVDDGCVLYLSNRKKSSSTWSDLSKSGNHGTVNGATLARNGYSFDGVSNYIDCGSDTSLNITNALTILAWVKLNDTSSAYTIVWRGDGTNYYGIKYINTTNNFRFNFKGATNCFSSTINDTTWHHLAGTYDKVNSIVYLDGIPGTPISNNLNIVSIAPLKLSKYIDGTYQALNGSIGEVRVYNRALSATEILNHYGKTRKFYGV